MAESKQPKKVRGVFERPKGSERLSQWHLPKIGNKAVLPPPLSLIEQLLNLPHPRIDERAQCWKNSKKVIETRSSLVFALHFYAFVKI